MTFFRRLFILTLFLNQPVFANSKNIQILPVADSVKVMIDGVKVTEDEVRSLPISFVERIDVVKNATALLALQTMVESEGTDSSGMPVYSYGYPDGVISIILKDHNASYLSNTVFYSVNTKISGYYEPRIFYSPKHHATLESDYKPDLRTTIFWEPNIKLRNNKDCTNLSD